MEKENKNIKAWGDAIEKKIKKLGEKKMNKKTVGNKIIDLLDNERPKPNIIECLRILQDLEDSFIEHLDENLDNNVNKKEKEESK